MTDHQLSTRDLAARSDGEEIGSSLETEQTPERTGDSDSSSQASASLANEPRTERAEGVGSRSSEAETQGASSPDAPEEPLFPTDQRDGFTARWQEIQTSFVDRPRDAVAEADSLVADLMQRLATSFAQERTQLEAQWDKGDDVSTEDLRLALQRYRSFFGRLLQA